MGVTKTEIFTDQQNQLSTWFRVLGHPARIAILQHLAQLNTCVCGDLAESIGLAQPTISQHLKELKAVGLIQGTIEGTRVCYCIDPKVWHLLETAFHSFFSTHKPKEDSCCDN